MSTMRRELKKEEVKRTDIAISFAVGWLGGGAVVFSSQRIESKRSDRVFARVGALEMAK